MECNGDLIIKHDSPCIGWRENLSYVLYLQISGVRFGVINVDILECLHPGDTILFYGCFFYPIDFLGYQPLEANPVLWLSLSQSPLIDFDSISRMVARTAGTLRDKM